MQTAFRVMGLSGLLVATLVSAPARAQEPAPASAPADVQQGTEADVHHNTEEPKQGEQAAPILQPTTTTTEAPAVSTAPPKRGDVSISGYFRGGFGATIQEERKATQAEMDNGMPSSKVGGRMTCFALSPVGLVAKYRLGNECEVWSETHFTIVTYVGEDGVVSNLHFMPTIFIPTTNIGYSPNGTVTSPAIFTTSTGATISFPNLYVDLQGIPWLGGGTAWAGTRYYKRESVYINDFFYWNPSGVGAGVEDIHLGKDLRLSYGLFAADGEPQMSDRNTDPLLPLQLDFGVRNDLQLRGIKPWPSGEFQVGFQYIADYSNHYLVDGTGNPVVDANGNTTSVTHSGWGVTLQYVQKLLGGDNKVALQYGKGGGTGFGTLSRFYYPDFSLYHAPIEYRVRAVEVLTIQPFPWLGAQVTGIYQYDQNYLGSPDQHVTWYSGGGRVSWAFTDHAKLLGEIGYDHISKNNGAKPQQLTKFTIAPVLAAGRGFLTRPELRIFYTWAVWNEAARGANVDSGGIYRSTPFLSGSTVGLQAETWF